MNNFKYILGIAILCIAFLSQVSIAQISHGGEPYSFSHQLDLPKSILIDQSELKNIFNEESKDCSALEFAYFLPLNISLNHTDWTIIETEKGGKIHQLRLKSPGASGIGVYFSELHIPKGGELFIYSPDHQQYIGSFNHLNNKESQYLATEFLLGDELIIEYFEPASVKGQTHFIVSDILHAYRSVSILEEERSFGDSDYCEVNVKCPEGEGKRDQRDAVVRILIRKGNSGLWCTGTLINNTSEDRTPYVLTADHCGKYSDEDDMLQWIFYFHYQTWGCGNPSLEPAGKSMEGCEKVAASSNAGVLGSDFFLIKLNEEIPVTYNPFFIGWNRTGLGSNSGYTIHHPQGDIKKISTYLEPLQSADYNSSGISGGFWEVTWSETESGHGVTEPGSSGSPIFDAEGSLIGTLTGGQASCSALTNPDFYGKFDMHWMENGDESDQQLMPWLDPIFSGVHKMTGTYLGLNEEELLSSKLVQIIPNPAQESALFYFSESHQNIKIQLFDLNGRLLKEIKQEGNSTIQISLAELQNGVYMIKAIDHQSSQTLRLIKN